ncbi:DUF4817 domain-containing protein [Trichonephila clavipes]|nr:DUF4817 domain-containing protein [Trichonephila clavipes]
MGRWNPSFKNDEGHNVTVNGDRYRAMITNFFIPEFNNHDVQELWFQQDGATCHTARATIDLLKDTFGDRLISRLRPVNWSPRSCDLTPLDYFLWSYLTPDVVKVKGMSVVTILRDGEKVASERCVNLSNVMIEHIFPSQTLKIQPTHKKLTLNTYKVQNKEVENELNVPKEVGCPLLLLRFTADYFTSLEDEEVDVRLAGVTRAGNYANKRLRIRKLMFPGTENLATGTSTCSMDGRACPSAAADSRMVPARIFVSLMVLLKNRHIERLMHVKSVKVQSLPVWLGLEGGACLDVVVET